MSEGRTIKYLSPKEAEFFFRTNREVYKVYDDGSSELVKDTEDYQKHLSEQGRFSLISTGKEKLPDNYEIPEAIKESLPPFITNKSVKIDWVTQLPVEGSFLQRLSTSIINFDYTPLGIREKEEKKFLNETYLSVFEMVHLKDGLETLRTTYQDYADEHLSKEQQEQLSQYKNIYEDNHLLTHQEIKALQAWELTRQLTYQLERPPVKLNTAQQDLLDDLMQSFEKGILPWRQGWDSSIGLPVNAVTDQPYNGINMISLLNKAYRKGYTDPRWCTFKQAQDAGWNVIKGETGSKILFFSVIDKRNNKPVDFSIFNKLSQEEKEKEQDNFRTVFKTSVVFNAAQIKGIPELDLSMLYKPKFDHELAKTYSKKVVENLNLDGGFHHEGTRAYYNYRQDKVVMPEVERFVDQEHYYATLWHELAHATGHKKRMDRFMSDSTPYFYALEELRAEFASFFQQVELGLNLTNTQENTIAYTQHWGSILKEKPELLFQLAREGNDIKRYLFSTSQLEFAHDNKRNQTYSVELEVVESKQMTLKLIPLKNDGETLTFETDFPKGLNVYESQESREPLLNLKNYIKASKLESLLKPSLFDEKEKTKRIKVELSDLTDDLESRLLRFRTKEKRNLVEVKYSDVEGIKVVQQVKNATQEKKATLEEMKKLVKITDYAENVLGFKVTRPTGKLYSLAEHDSVRIYPDQNTFMRYSTNNVGGSVIDFIMHFEEKSQKDAIKSLVSYYYSNVDAIRANPVQTKVEHGIFKLPVAAKNNDKLIDYLTNTRKIAPEVVNNYIESNLLYQSKDNKIVMVGNVLGNLGAINRFATTRSINDDIGYRDVAGSKKSMGIYKDNGSRDLVVTESVIDAMSHETLKRMNKDDSKCDYLSVNGVGAAISVIDFHMNVRHKATSYDSITIIFDNDEAGLQAANDLQEHINTMFNQGDKNKIKVSYELPDAIDLNDDLQHEVEKEQEMIARKKQTQELIEKYQNQQQQQGDLELK